VAQDSAFIAGVLGASAGALLSASVAVTREAPLAPDAAVGAGALETQLSTSFVAAPF